MAEKNNTPELIVKLRGREEVRIPLEDVQLVRMPLNDHGGELWVRPPSDAAVWFLGALSAEVMIMHGRSNELAHMHPDSSNSWRATLAPLAMPPHGIS